MQDFGVNLICVEDGVDSSNESGKLMISIRSAVAELERENILVQTMEGRKQKAREEKWNGGFAPYCYALEDGSLVIAEDEAEVIRLIKDCKKYYCSPYQYVSYVLFNKLFHTSPFFLGFAYAWHIIF